MAVTVYRSDDAGAPTLTGEYGSIITLLDAVLVNGYGAKAAAGWTKEFTGTNQAVYRNSAVNGSGTFYQIDNGSGQANVSAANLAYVRGASNCTGFDALTEAFGGSTWIAAKSSAAATVTQWIIVADAHTAMIFVAGSIGSAQVGIEPTAKFLAHYIGDSHGYGNGNVSSPVIAGNTVSNSTNGFNSLIGVDPGINPQKSESGVVEVFATKAVKYGLNSGGGVGYPHENSATQLYRGKSLIREISYGTSVTERAGIFRGLWFPASGIFGATLDQFTLNGKTYMTILTDEDTDSVVFIEVSDTWRAAE